MRFSDKTKLEAYEAQKAFDLWQFEQKDKDFDPLYDLCTIVRLAKTYNLIQERACNGQEGPRDEAREKSIERQVSGLAGRYGLAARFSGDPRGYCIKLCVTGKKKPVYNTWGGASEGYGVGK